jgi:SOS-response transcriptional repressor LexA
MSAYRYPDGPLPPRQAELLAFIRARIAADAPLPTQREIADYMGWKNESSAADALMRLAWRGAIPPEWTSGKLRARAFAKSDSQ